MSGAWGMVGGTLVGQGGAAAWEPPTLADTSAVVAVAADASAHTKGAWVQLVASTSADADLAIVAVHGVSTGSTNTATLLDIAVGGSGSEIPIVSDVAVGGAETITSSTFTIPLPVSIPAGSRISARIQSVVTGGKTAQVAIALAAGSEITPGTLTTLGTSTGTSAGTALGTGWTQIVASTAATYRWLIAVPSLASGVATAGTESVEVATGAASSEVLIGTIPAVVTATERIYSSPGAAWDRFAILPGVPAGTRLSARRAVACDLTIIGVA